MLKTYIAINLHTFFVERSNFIYFLDATKMVVLMLRQSVIDNAVTLAIFISCFEHVLLPQDYSFL